MTATANSEQLAVASLITYDVYRTYINPKVGRLETRTILFAYCVCSSVMCAFPSSWSRQHVKPVNLLTHQAATALLSTRIIQAIASHRCMKQPWPSVGGSQDTSGFIDRDCDRQCSRWVCGSAVGSRMTAHTLTCTTADIILSRGLFVCLMRRQPASRLCL